MLTTKRRSRWTPCVGLSAWMAIVAVGPVAWVHPPDDDLPPGLAQVASHTGVWQDVASFAPVEQHAAHCVFCHTLRSSQPGRTGVRVVAAAASPAVAPVRPASLVGPALAPSAGRSPPA